MLFRSSSGVIAVTVLLLVEKSRLHALVARIDDDEMRAAARFGVMAVVILPLLPEGPFGPWGSIKPRELWVLVLFFTALSFGAYVARRLVGPGRGYTLAGLLGGLISSTNVTFTFARLSRQEQALSRALAVGTATTIAFAPWLRRARIAARIVAPVASPSSTAIDRKSVV